MNEMKIQHIKIQITTILRGKTYITKKPTIENKDKSD